MIYDVETWASIRQREICRALEHGQLVHLTKVQPKRTWSFHWFNGQRHARPEVPAVVQCQTC
jgi:hypothetical protein